MRKIILGIAILSQLNVFAQTNTDLRPQVKSPEVNKFEQYMNMPVNLVSGTPQVSIPIYTLEYGGMSLPISLEYDASGVKVESIASCVGQNWTLNVGGVVSRIVKGAPDEGNPYATGIWSNIDVDGFYQDYGLTKLENQLNNFPASELPYNPNSDNGRENQYERWLMDLNKGNKDSEPDLFYFSTPQGGSKFVFNDQRKVVYLENTDFIIKENFDENDFKSWDVTSASGVKYKYGIDNPTSYQGRGNICEANYTLNTTGYTNGLGFVVNHYIANSWFLTEMKNYQTNHKIELEYVDNKYSYKINSDKSGFTGSCSAKTVNNNGITSIIYASIYPNSSCASDSEEGSYFMTAAPSPQSYIYNYVNSKLISKIKAGDKEINFIYSTRTDLEQCAAFDDLPKKLDEIKILYKGQCIKRFIFNISTSTCPASINSANPDFDDYSRKRLFLESMTEIDCNEQKTEKPYTFIYNPINLPNRMSYAQDKWGYFNGVMDNPSMFPKYGAIANQAYANRSVNFVSSKAGVLESIIYPTKGTVNFEFEQHQSNVPIDTDDYVRDNSLYYAQGLMPYSPTAFSNSFNSKTFTVTDSHIKLKMSLIYGTSSFSTPLASCPVHCYANAMEILNSSGTIIYNESYGQLENLQNANPGQSVTKTIEHFLYDNNNVNSIFIEGETYTVKVYGINGCYHATLDLVVPKSEIASWPIYTVGGLRIKKIIHKNYDNTVVKEMKYTYIKPKAIYRFEKCVTFDYSCFDNIDTFGATSSNGLPFISLLNRQYLKDYLISKENITLLRTSMGRFRFVSPGKDLYNIDFMGPYITYQQVIETDGVSETKHEFEEYKNHLELHGYGSLDTLPIAPVFQLSLAGEKTKVISFNSVGVNLKENNYKYNYMVANVVVNAGINLKLGSNSDGLTRCYPIYVGQTKTLKSETETTNLNGNTVTKTTGYEYNGNGHNQPTKITTTDNQGNQSLITNLTYPLDIPSPDPSIRRLILENRKETPIKTENYRGTEKISEQTTEYEIYPSDAAGTYLTLPKFVYSKKGNEPSNPLEKKVSYNYDTHGNLIEYTPENGVTTSIIWGYNNTQPIAKLENCVYATIAISTINNLKNLSNNNNEANLLNELNNLRAALPNAMVSSYTYKPLIGISTMTDAKGDKMTYEYDEFNRLKWVKDKEGNILSENQYHYKK